MGLAILNRMVRKDLTEKLTFEETADGDEGVDRLIFGGRWFQAEGTASAKALRLGSGGRGRGGRVCLGRLQGLWHLL